MGQLVSGAIKFNPKETSTSGQTTGMQQEAYKQTAPKSFNTVTWTDHL